MSRTAQRARMDDYAAKLIHSRAYAAGKAQYHIRTALDALRNGEPSRADAEMRAALDAINGGKL